jgi:hypothetical protein
LLSKSPEHKRNFLEQQVKTEQWLEKTKRELDDLLRSSNSLRRLKEAGAIPERILHILALEVRQRHWPRELRLTKVHLKSLANELRGLADEVQRTYGKKESHLDFWLLALQQDQKTLPIPASKKDSAVTPSGDASASGRARRHGPKDGDVFEASYASSCASAVDSPSSRGPCANGKPTSAPHTAHGNTSGRLQKVWH